MKKFELIIDSTVQSVEIQNMGMLLKFISSSSYDKLETKHLYYLPTSKDIPLVKYLEEKI